MPIFLTAFREPHRLALGPACAQTIESPPCGPPLLNRILSAMSDPITRLNAALEGRYTIEREIGEGGMATVYLAEDVKHERKVALTVLKPELAAVGGAEV